MSLKPFSFLNPEGADPNAKNWRSFDEASKTIVKTNMAITSGTATPTVDAGYFTLYGPIVFYTIKITLNNNDGWTTSSYIQMPFHPLLASSTFQAAHHGEVFIGLTGVVLSSAIFTTTANPDRLGFGTAYTNTSGSDQLVYIQGWYFRN
jgi:hypothetical protein